MKLVNVMATSLTCLVTGANRGLGFEFVQQLLARSNYKVIATCRNPSDFTSNTSSANANLTVLPLDLLDQSSIEALPNHLQGQTLDVVIHNAGVSSTTHPTEPIMTATRENLLKCFQCNTMGTLELTKQLLPFMEASQHKKMLFVSSKMGSMTATHIDGKAAGDWTSSVSYRVSKAALNMGVRCLAAEIGGAANSGVCFTSCHPGWVDTDMGSAGGRAPPLTPQESISHILENIVDVMANDTHNGVFCNYDGSILPW